MVTDFRGLSCFYHETWRGILENNLKIVGQHSWGAVINLLSVPGEQNRFAFHHNVRSHVQKPELTGNVSMKIWLKLALYLCIQDNSDIAVLADDKLQASAQLALLRSNYCPGTLSLTPSCLSDAPSSWCSLSWVRGQKSSPSDCPQSFCSPGSWRRLCSSVYMAPSLAILYLPEGEGVTAQADMFE